MNNKRSWVSTPKEVLIIIKIIIRINKINNPTKNSTRLIIYPNEKNWLPILKNFLL